MAVPDMKKILELKQVAMKRCEDRILQAASRPPCTKHLEDTDSYGMTRRMKSKYGL
ncbi:MAG TPA: hypothetical protein PK024_11530 [Methanospirillum sp.]|uniref:hypothetical protein n=1 Tax=Methanospirillum sp. TaxID=45200 RepID=UPI002B78C9B5|nr:hypothetical protein [Methanospirillum sp.]HOJ97451.1 hypothetical protein [Methanospirillum sp.]HOL41969.1 hypothetical protein [Methanospirillum sp.]HPP79223.1 hypothetical protein [Methanospirillum sp.]